ncbi:MAG: hypothetical protein CMH26_00350 [Micavibrio sp.]|nr:hypothetical protein [Micavibrio sp.]|tara:strand:- start:2011 stop:2937 length:927 start_codon:yes stop_codon:yes gene_type:complete
MIIHIGFPKSASTSLQRSLAGSKSGLFLGCNPKAALGEFYHEAIGEFLEKDIRFAPNDVFNEQAEEIASALQDLDFHHQGCVTLSYENLSFRLTPHDLPADIKLARLAQISPQNTQWLIIYRPVTALLKSLYKNYLLIGYTATPQQFIDELTLLGDYGPLADLDLARLKTRSSEFAPKISLKIVRLEQSEALVNFFAQNGIEIEPLAKENSGFTDEEIAHALHFNQQQKADKTYLSWLELHRIYPNKAMDESVKFKLSRYRHALNEALDNAAQITPQEHFEFNWSKEILELEARNTAFLKENAELLIA